jgi:hypothetical protein
MKKVLAGLASVLIASAVFAGDVSSIQWEKIVYGTNFLSTTWVMPYTRGVIDRVWVGCPDGDTNTVTMKLIQNAGKWTNTVTSTAISSNAGYTAINPSTYLLEMGDSLTLTYSHAKTTTMVPYGISVRDTEK